MTKMDRTRNALLNRVPEKMTFEQKCGAGESEGAGENNKCRGPASGARPVWPGRPVWACRTRTQHELGTWPVRIEGPVEVSVLAGCCWSHGGPAEQRRRCRLHIAQSLCLGGRRRLGSRAGCWVPVKALLRTGVGLRGGVQVMECLHPVHAGSTGFSTENCANWQQS